MGNFEKLSVLVIVVIIVMILVVALYTWTGDSASPDTATKDAPAKTTELVKVDKSTNVFPIPPTPSPATIPPLPPILKPGETGMTTGTTGTSGVVVPPLNVVPGAVPVDPKKTAVAERTEKSYEVASGDNATRIIRHEMAGTSIKSGLAMLEKANPGVDLNMLHVGQKLVIPGKSAEIEAVATPGGKEGTTASVKEKAGVEGLKPGSVYVTRRGDTLPALSKRAYGTTDRWHEIWLANYSTLEDPSAVPAGTRLRLPN